MISRRKSKNVWRTNEGAGLKIQIIERPCYLFLEDEFGDILTIDKDDLDELIILLNQYSERRESA